MKEQKMKRILFRTFFIGLIFVIAASGQPQIKKLLKKIPKKIPGIEDILKSKPAISTSIQDAVTEISFLDDFNPQNPYSMIVLPRTSEGDFLLDLKGFFRFECQSYCLRAGTYGPSEDRGGSGYLYAPIKGLQADIVRNILQRSYVHPEIPQKDIQVLLWAIIARTKISDMSRHMQLTAARLLTKEEIFRLNGGALGLVPDDALRKAISNLPPAAHRILEAEARLRQMMTRGSASYEELERVAVLRGDPPPEKGDREVPPGRWSFHPNGYFIRYFPRGYTRMIIEIYVPELFVIERDGKGRITAIADMEGNHIQTDYNDAVAPMDIPGDPSLKGYAFRHIRFERLNPDDPDKKMSTEWNDAGWTLHGVPAGGGSAAVSSGRFSDAKERYEWCKSHKKDLDRLNEGIKKISGMKSPQGLSEEDIDSIMSLGHYAVALKKALARGASADKDWIASHIDLVKKAWQFEANRCAGTYRTADTSMGYDGRAEDLLTHSLAYNKYNPLPTAIFLAGSTGASDGSDSANPSGGAAQPGEGGRQRLAPSPRDTDDEEDCQGTVVMVKGDVKVNGKQVQQGDTLGSPHCLDKI
jgi:hypothetical protein